ncbi:serine protease inhibitor Kazal-type 1-like [Danio aesculapii]|uniref:serine protease inhibitor Kazal-type 1-like n=1 Tax=Danio aesculapii TaxID=1142201 RepID=UPI0024C04422|nr:serine protease inhibitor Kazal-type 1-like [Danio aesculapii]
MLARIVLVLCLAGLAQTAAMPFGLSGFNDIDSQCFIYSNGMCPREYNPVCGTDGVTYSNRCMLCWEIFMGNFNLQISKMGEC